MQPSREPSKEQSNVRMNEWFVWMPSISLLFTSRIHPFLDWKIHLFVAIVISLFFSCFLVFDGGISSQTLLLFDCNSGGD